MQKKQSGPPPCTAGRGAKTLQWAERPLAGGNAPPSDAHTKSHKSVSARRGGRSSPPEPVIQKRQRKVILELRVFHKGAGPLDAPLMVDHQQKGSQRVRCSFVSFFLPDAATPALFCRGRSKRIPPGTFESERKRMNNHRLKYCVCGGVNTNTQPWPHWMSSDMTLPVRPPMDRLNLVLA